MDWVVTWTGVMDYKKLSDKTVEASSVLIAIGPHIVRRFPMTMRCATGAYGVKATSTWTSRLVDYNRGYHRARKGLVQHRLSLWKQTGVLGS